jgi:hypothetical protein
LRTKQEHPHFNLSGLGSCRKWQSFGVAAVSRGSGLHLAPIHGSHRCHAVVLEGRISVLGDGGGVVELSRTIFGCNFSVASHHEIGNTRPNPRR